MLAEAAAAALPALSAHPLVLADAGATALLAVVALPPVLALAALPPVLAEAAALLLPPHFSLRAAVFAAAAAAAFSP